MEDIKKKRSSNDNRRYKLHQKIKQLFEFYSRKKLIIITFDYDLKDKFVIELRDRFKYQIQYSIISPNEINVNEYQIISN